MWGILISSSEVPEVKTTTEDPVKNDDHSTTSPKSENGAGIVSCEPNGDEMMHDAAVQTQEKNSKKRVREEGNSSEVQPDAKKVDTKDES